MQDVLITVEKVQPDVKKGLAGPGEGVHAAGRARLGGVPERGDQASPLQLAQGPVDSGGVEGGQPRPGQLLDQLVAVGVPAAEEGKEAGDQQVAVEAGPEGRLLGLVVGGFAAVLVPSSHSSRCPSFHNFSTAEIWSGG